MCFSAPVSFVASGALMLAGCYTVRESLRRDPRFLLIALIPIFFSIQQFSEGIVWLFITEPYTHEICQLSKNSFLFFAFSFWPVWMPLAIAQVEKNTARRNWIYICLGMGIVVSLLSFINIKMLAATPYEFSLYYALRPQDNLPHPDITFYHYAGSFIPKLLYMTAATGPFFLSSVKKIPLFGAYFLVSALIIGWIDLHYFYSLWCFAGAIGSLLIYLIIKDQPKKMNSQKK